MTVVRTQPISPPPCPVVQRVAGRRPGSYARIDVRAHNTKRTKYNNAWGPRGSRDPLFLEVQPDGSDLWRLDAVVDLLKDGGVGVIPTDSFPAIVCDLENKAAVERLYDIQRLKPSKLLSILVRNFKDVSTYTLGFAVSNVPGQVDGFHLAKQVLPGPYTIILTASKALPKQVDFGSGKSKSRRTVGVRMPADPVCQAILSQLDRPLLASSVQAQSDSSKEEEDGVPKQLPEPAVLFDWYAQRGIDFLVSTGSNPWTPGSSVVDMTTAVPHILREGEGDVDIFRQKEFAV